MHAHMSNTRNTPIEALEYGYPVQVERYAIRRGSGGPGIHPGGDGLIRAIKFHSPVRVTVVSERRRSRPYGLGGGRPGSPGRNLLIRGTETRTLPGKFTIDLTPGDTLSIETPGGGGWGEQQV
jgi:N-methylhydantoinase B